MNAATAPAVLQGASVAAVGAGLVGCLAATAFAAGVLADGSPEAPLVAVLFAPLPLVAALVVTLQPRNSVGWLLLVIAAMQGVGTFGLSMGERLSESAGQSLAWIGQIAFLAPAVTGTFLLLLFPNGHLPSSRWRPAVWVAGASITMIAFAFLLSPGPMDGNGLENPFGIGRLERFFAVAVPVAYVAVLTSGLASLASLAFRYAKGDRRTRRQLLFPCVAAALMALAWLAVMLLPEAQADDAAAVLGLSLIAVLPMAMGLAVLRHGLYNASRRTRALFAHLFTWLAVILAFVVALPLVDATGSAQVPLEVAALITLLVATAYAPIQRWLSAIADRWIFAPAPTELDVVSSFGGAAAASTDSLAVARRLAKAAGTALNACWVEVEVDGRTVAIEGEAGPVPDLRVPLVRAGSHLGELRLGPRPGGEYAQRDIQLVEVLAGQASVALHSVQLAHRLVHTQDLERRRLERDLHDGAQQDLVALVARLSLARRQVSRDPAMADAALVEIDRNVRRLLVELRDLARGIHPTSLTEGGLLEAVRDRVARLPIPATLEATGFDNRLRLAPEIEAAAYYTVSEGLTNALKYAGGSKVRLELHHHNEVLEVTVCDNGVGFDAGTRRRNGLAALSDRLAALGGSLVVESSPRTGTTLMARLPAIPRETTDV